MTPEEFSWANCYLGDPVASRAVFGGDRFIHTGDIGTFDSDGFLVSFRLLM
jgi:long-subunit acyl-CoA synthetase (AMP-forming)